MNAGTRELIRNSDFRRLWLVGLLTGSIRWLEVLAVGLYTLSVTGSPLIVALMLFARTIPGVIFGSITGALASQYGRRRLLMLGLSIMGTLSFCLMLLSYTGQLELWHIAVGALASGIVWTLEHPVRRTLLSDVAGIQRIQHAMSLDTLSFNSTRFIGTLSGCSLFAALGMTGVYATSFSAFALALLLVFGTAVMGQPAATARTAFISSLLAGWRYARDVPVVRAILLVTVLTNFFGFSYATMVPVLARSVYDLSPAQTGLLQSMEGLGAMIMALFLALSTLPLSQVRWFSGGAMGFFVCIFVFAATGMLFISTASLLVAGGALAAFGAMQSTVLISRSDPAQRERVMGLLVVSIGAQPAGVLTLGYLAEVLGPAAGLMAMAAAGLLCVITLVVAQPALWTPVGATKNAAP